MPFHHLLISRRLVAHEVDHPAPVWAGGGEVAAQQVVGDRVPLGGPGGAHRPARPGAGQTPAPACAAPAVHRATPGPSCREPGSRQVFLDPSVALNGSALRARILIAPGRRPRSTSWRAGGTGRRNRWTGRSCTLTRSGRCRSGTGPAAPPLRWSMHSADQRDGRSHSAAIDKPTRSARSRPPPPARGPPSPAPRCAGPPRWWCRAGRRRPTRTPWRTRPRRVSGPAPSSSPTRLKHPLDRSGSARAPRRQPDRAVPRLIGVLPGCGHDPHPSMDSDPPPHPGRSSGL